MENFWQQFARALRKLRIRSGLSQQAIADALGVNRATYSYYELGTTAPDFQRIVEIAQLLDISVGDLAELLAHPEEVSRWKASARTPKKVLADPQTLGQLRPEEKSLIAIFRRCDPASRYSGRAKLTFKCREFAATPSRKR